MKAFILGTAGHVDHGKSSLIKKLTDVDPDRLPEEKERGLSIDLGFAPLRLESPDGASESIHLGIVDVPGHQRFLRNMISGVGGFDAVLLVVDSTEGVKPQTQEHLRILDLLQTKSGIVVLSKADRNDEEGLEIARWEVEELLRGTFLEGAPIVATSAHTGEGLDELKSELYALFSKLTPRSADGLARLPIDRAFSKTGFGKIVTGSLWSGRLEIGQEVELLPSGEQGRVRGLQVHGTAVEAVFPGQRAAINVSGIDGEQLKRGQTLVSPPRAFPMADGWAASVTLIESEPKLLKRKTSALFYQATGRHRVSVSLVGDRDESREVFGHLGFESPLPLSRGDRFLLRDGTDSRLIGGGTILCAEAKSFRRSRKKENLERYRSLETGGKVGAVLEFLKQRGGYASEAVVRKHQGLSGPEWDKELEGLLDSGRVVRVSKRQLWLTDTLESLSSQVVGLLERLAEAAPWKPGWQVGELAPLLKMRTGREQGLNELLEFLVELERLDRTGPYYRPAGHTPVLEGSELERASQVIAILTEERFSPRDWEFILREVCGEDKRSVGRLEEYLFGMGEVVRLSERLVTTPEVMTGAKEELASAYARGFTASEARQQLETSRKYIIPMLEWMDQQGWTVRVGDKRIVSQNS